VKIEIAEYRPRAADLLAFSAPWSEPSGWLIKLATRSIVSHVAGVGIVSADDLERELRQREWPRRPSALGRALHRLTRTGFERRPLIFESTTECDSPCAIAGEKVSGVQAHEPRQRIAEYIAAGGRAWLYRPARDFRIEADQSRRLTEFLLRHLGARYDFEQAAFSGTIVARRVCRWATRGNLHSLFCSKYWAAALEQIHLLGLSNPSLFTPAKLIDTVTEVGTMQLAGEFRGCEAGAVE